MKKNYFCFLFAIFLTVGGFFSHSTSHSASRKWITLFGYDSSAYSYKKGQIKEFDNIRERFGTEQEKKIYSGVLEADCEITFTKKQNIENCKTLKKLNEQTTKDNNHKRLVEFIHYTINRFGYRSDKLNYGFSDYWATPYEFLTKGSGDCEDYSITKYVALRILGFRPEQLRLVVVKLENRGLYHAVLAVNLTPEKTDSPVLILDNLIRDPLKDNDSNLKDYRPIYALNENHYWTQFRPKGTSLTLKISLSTQKQQSPFEIIPNIPKPKPNRFFIPNIPKPNPLYAQRNWISGVLDYIAINLGYSEQDETTHGVYDYYYNLSQKDPIEFLEHQGIPVDRDDWVSIDLSGTNNKIEPERLNQEESTEILLDYLMNREETTELLTDQIQEN